MFERFDFIDKCNCCGETSNYTQEVGDGVSIKMCFNCGFSTNTLMKKDSEYLKTQFEVLPDVYKALSGESEIDGLVYIPSYVDNDLGVVFAYGLNDNDWQWIAMKKKKVEGVDTDDLKFAKNTNDVKYVADKDTTEAFHKESFLEALAYIGMLDNIIKAD